MGSGKVAVPYYGRVYLPKVGYEQIYFIVEDGQAKSKDLNVSLRVWDNKTGPTLPEWLEHNGIENLVCKEDPEVGLKNAIVSMGIRVLNESNTQASLLMNNLLV